MENFKRLIVDILVRYSFQILGATVVLVVGYLIGKRFGNFVTRSLANTRIDESLRRLVGRFATWTLWALAALLALEKFGLQIAPFVAGLGVLGLAISFAVQGPLANLAAGIVIILSRHFKVGDYIEVMNVKGQVQRIELSVTVLKTLEDSLLIIPNRRLVGEILHNYTGERRVELAVWVSYRDAVGRAIEIIQAILRDNPRVLRHPLPDVGVVELGESNIKLLVRPWVKAQDYWQVHYEIYRSILERFRQEKIEIPYPQREVRVIERT